MVLSSDRAFNNWLQWRIHIRRGSGAWPQMKMLGGGGRVCFAPLILLCGPINIRHIFLSEVLWILILTDLAPPPTEDSFLRLCLVIISSLI